MEQVRSSEVVRHALMISALKRKQGTDLLSAPRVTVMDGQVCDYHRGPRIYLSNQDYELPAPVHNHAGGGAGNNDGGGLRWCDSTAKPAIPRC